MCLFLRVASHQSMIRAEQFCKDAHQELSGERRGKNGLSEVGGMSQYATFIVFVRCLRGHWEF